MTQKMLFTSNSHAPSNERIVVKLAEAEFLFKRESNVCTVKEVVSLCFSLNIQGQGAII